VDMIVERKNLRPVVIQLLDISPMQRRLPTRAGRALPPMLRTSRSQNPSRSGMRRDLRRGDGVPVRPAPLRMAPGPCHDRATGLPAGRSQAGIPFIHVAGTNGKGSTAAMLDAIFRAAGYARVCIPPRTC